jgi:Protein of unknown function (DUF2569)
MFDKLQTNEVRRLLILLLLLSMHQICFANRDDSFQVEGNFNWITIWLSFFFGLLFTVLFRYVNNISISVDQRSDAGQPLNAWIIFLGVNLVIRLLIQAYLFWKAGYFLKNVWMQLGQAGGAKFQSLYIFEFFLSMFALAATSALLYWFFGRRDIFPMMFVYYIIIYLVTAFIRLAIYQETGLPKDLAGINHSVYLQLLRISYAIGWVIYILKSDRVKKVFIYPPG